MVARGGEAAIRSFIEARTSRLAELAVGRNESAKRRRVKRFVRAAFLGASRRPQLWNCTPESFFAAVLLCLRLGLMPDARLALAHLSAEFMKDDDGNTFGEVAVTPGYVGFVDLLLRQGDVIAVRSFAVYEHDKFKLQLGPEPILRHEPRLRGDRGGCVGVYAVARLRDGRKELDFLTRKDIESVRPDEPTEENAGSARNWGTREEVEIWKTLAIKRLCKSLARSDELRAAIYLERGAEKIKTRPRVIDVLASLGIDLEEAAPLKAPQGAPEKPRCCKCGNNDRLLAHVYTCALFLQPQGCLGCGLTSARHWLCSDCERQLKAFDAARLAIANAATKSLSCSGGVATKATTLTSSEVAAPPEPLSPKEWPWQRITSVNEVLAVTQQDTNEGRVTAERFMSVMNGGGDSIDETVTHVFQIACSTRGTAAVNKAHRAAGGRWSAVGEGGALKDQQRMPLTVNEARQAWDVLIDRQAVAQKRRPA